MNYRWWYWKPTQKSGCDSGQDEQTDESPAVDETPWRDVWREDEADFFAKDEEGQLEMLVDSLNAAYEDLKSEDPHSEDYGK